MLCKFVDGPSEADGLKEIRHSPTSAFLSSRPLPHQGEGSMKDKTRRDHRVPAAGVSGPDPDRNISPISLCGPEISGPDEDVVVWA